MAPRPALTLFADRPPPGFRSWRQVMDLALGEARKAALANETPVGAVLVEAASGRVLASAHNTPLGLTDPTAHAEILALRRGALAAGNYRLGGTVLAVTLEPCLMCLGAMAHARIGGLVFGARDPKAGAVVSNLQGTALPFLNHRFAVLEGVLAEECGAMLSRFFAARRKEKTQKA